MEDLEPAAEGSIQGSPLPQALDDPADPLNPDIEEENEPDAPISAPTQDVEATENKDDLSDDESVLSDIDEAQFGEFDADAVAIEERPIAVDENNIALIGTHKRKRAEGEEGEGRKKKREGKREKTKKSRRATSGDDADGDEGGKSSRRRRDDDGGEKRRARRPSPDENTLTPEERRKRALDKAMDEAVRNPNARRGKKKDEIELSTQQDELIENMRRRMTEAAKADTDARQAGQPAMQKLQLLPDVVSLLNRNTLRDQLVDPDTNLLEAVRFFLEPLNDGSLPAYNIQRELFASLGKLPINKDVLIASGIGKVTLFYTKSTKPELNIKRQAERLLGEWTRRVLKRTDDYSKKEVSEAVYDPYNRPTASQSQSQNPDHASSQSTATQRAALAARERQLATPILYNRARVEGGLASYNIAPRSNVTGTGQVAQRMGTGGSQAFRRMTTKKSAGGR